MGPSVIGGGKLSGSRFMPHTPQMPGTPQRSRFSPIVELHRLAGNAAVTRMLTDSPPINIQRDIGLEMEFGYVETFRTVKGMLGSEKRERLGKRQELAPSRHGFLITADDPPAGSSGVLSDLELIVHPPVDDMSPQGRGQFQASLVAMQALISSLVALTPKRGTDISATKFGGAADLFVSPQGSSAFDSGQIQVTAGLSYPALAQIRSGAAYKRFDRALQATNSDKIKAYAMGSGGAGHAPEYWDACRRRTEGIISVGRLEITDDHRDILASVMSLIVQIPISAWLNRGNLPYPKAAALLMARTDFSAIIRKMPWPLGKLVSEYHSWNEMLLGVVNQFVPQQLKESDRIFPSAFSTKGVPQLRLTLGEWFSGMGRELPVDRLTEEDYPSSLGKSEAAAVEGLGAFREKVDPGQRPIYEFRGLKSVTWDHLADVGLGFWDYIADAHANYESTQSVPSRPSAPLVHNNVFGNPTIGSENL